MNVNDCQRLASVICLKADCPGSTDPKACSITRQLALARGNTRSAPKVDPAVRDAVNVCPHRGGELPVSAYRLEGCCAGPTRWACSAGLGKVPGQPTLRDCLACRQGHSPPLATRGIPG